MKPVTEKDVTETTVYLPAEDQPYYDYFDFTVHRSNTKGRTITVPAVLDRIPLLIRGGSIITTRERPRRASTAMKYDPFTFRVALSKSGVASGELYLDDGDSYDHEKGQLVWRQLAADKTASKKVRKPLLKISSRDLALENPNDAVDGVVLRGAYTPNNLFAETIKDVRVERLVVVGLERKPKSIKVEDEGRELTWDWLDGVGAGHKAEDNVSVLIVKDPQVRIVKDWVIVVE